MKRLITKFRSSVLVFLTHQMALPVLRIIRKPQIFPYSMETLEQFPPATIGRELFEFLDERKLPLLPHYAKHDIKHILLGYDTTDEGEVCLQSFMLGNRHLSFPVAATVVYGFITMPEHWGKFVQAFKRGRNSFPVSSLRWLEILSLPSQPFKSLLNEQKNTHL